MKFITISFFAIFFSLTLQAKEVECPNDQIGILLDGLFKPESPGDTNKGVIGDKKPSEVILHPSDASEARLMCIANARVQMKKENDILKYNERVAKCQKANCEELATIWVNLEKDNIVSKYAVSYHPEQMANHARSGSINLNNSCIVYSANKIWTTSKCTGSKESEGFCQNEYICPDKDGKYSVETSSMISLVCDSQPNLKCHGILYQDCMKNYSPVSTHQEKKSDLELNKRTGVNKE